MNTRQRVMDHVIAYDHLPQGWAAGLPLGNGELGVMCWGDNGNLRFTIDSASAWSLLHDFAEYEFEHTTYGELVDLFRAGQADRIGTCLRKPPHPNSVGPTKLHLGRFELQLSDPRWRSFALSLGEAAVSGECEINGEATRLHTYVCRTHDVFCLSLTPWPEGAALRFRPLADTVPEFAELGNPPVEVHQEGGLTIAVQTILPDTVLALCWNDCGPEIAVSYAYGDDLETAKRQAVNSHPSTNSNCPEDLWREHVLQWRDFWSVSAVCLPERDLEFLWYFGLYLLAGSARLGSLPPGLQGLWAMDGRLPPWKGDYHADMNVQETFWSACPSGHLDLLDVWLDHAFAMLPRAEEMTRAVFGTPGAFQVCSTAPDHVPVGPLLAGWATVTFAWSHTGWLAHLAWLRWRYSMSTDWLAARGYPIVRSAFLFYAHNLEEEEDGSLHIPLSTSPEYDGPEASAWCQDPNIDIALIRTCCDWLVEMEKALGQNDLTARAEDIHQRLVPYHLVEFEHPASYARGDVPTGRHVLALWQDKPLDYSHRHPSHLMAIHPAMDLTIEGTEEERRIIAASVRHYLSLGQYCWAGHTYAQLISLAAVIGEAGMAHNFLRRFRDSWIGPNGLHFNREIGCKGDSCFAMPDGRIDRECPFTMEASCSITCGISDMLVQGWGGRIRIFPAVPDHWQDLSFQDLRTEGAFAVSALRRNGQTCRVEITATADGVCRLRNPFGANAFQTAGAAPTASGQDLVWQLAKGETVGCHLPGYDVLPENANRASASAQTVSSPPGPAPDLSNS